MHNAAVTIGTPYILVGESEMRRAESGVDDHSRGVVTLEFLGEGVDHLLLTRRTEYR